MSSDRTLARRRSHRGGSGGDEQTSPTRNITCPNGQDQKDIRDWVHGFAANGCARRRTSGMSARRRRGRSSRRPPRSASTASRGGPVLRRPDRLGCRSSTRSCSGATPDGMAIMGTSLAVAAIFGQGTGEQIGEWIPRSSAPRRRRGRALCASEPNTGSDVSRLCVPAKFDEATGEWVLNGQKAWATNGGIAESTS